jgi:hypothetical protein
MTDRRRNTVGEEEDTLSITEVSVTDTAHSHAMGEKGEQAGRRETRFPVHFIVAHAQHLREHILVREHILESIHMPRTWSIKPFS